MTPKIRHRFDFVDRGNRNSGTNFEVRCRPDFLLFYWVIIYENAGKIWNNHSTALAYADIRVSVLRLRFLYNIVILTFDILVVSRSAAKLQQQIFELKMDYLISLRCCIVVLLRIMFRTFACTPTANGKSKLILSVNEEKLIEDIGQARIHRLFKICTYQSAPSFNNDDHVVCSSNLTELWLAFLNFTMCILFFFLWVPGSLRTVLYFGRSAEQQEGILSLWIEEFCLLSDQSGPLTAREMRCCWNPKKIPKLFEVQKSWPDFGNPKLLENYTVNSALILLRRLVLTWWHFSALWSQRMRRGVRSDGTIWHPRRVLHQHRRDRLWKWRHCRKSQLYMHGPAWVCIWHVYSSLWRSRSIWSDEPSWRLHSLCKSLVPQTRNWITEGTRWFKKEAYTLFPIIETGCNTGWFKSKYPKLSAYISWTRAHRRLWDGSFYAYSCIFWYAYSIRSKS